MDTDSDSCMARRPSGGHLRRLLVRRWRKRGYTEGTIAAYLVWVQRYQASCLAVGRDEFRELTRQHAVGLARGYGAKPSTKRRASYAAESALRAMSRTLTGAGWDLPMWAPPPKPDSFARVAGWWREAGYSETTIKSYLEWLRRHRTQYGVHGRCRLTRREVLRFVRAYARRRGINASRACRSARTALRAWSRALAEMGEKVPPWTAPNTPGPFADLLAEYRRFRKCLRGVQDSSSTRECQHIRNFLGSLGHRSPDLSAISVPDIDRFLIDFGCKRKPKTVAGACTSLRSFFRFLHATGRISTDLSPLIAGPHIRRMADLPRGLPWAEVRKLLRAIDRSTLIGKRDYAAILLMASYGMGSAEVRRLSLEDIDWIAGTLRVVRPKTGVVTVLPLLGPVGEALAEYLKSGPPRRPPIRAIFGSSAKSVGDSRTVRL